MKYFKRIVTGFYLLSLFGCTHSHVHLVSSTYHTEHTQKRDQFAVVNSIQVITTQSPLFYSHAAVRLTYKGQRLFWDPSGSYGVFEERPEYYVDNPIPINFSRTQGLITQGIPDLPLYWKYSIYTGDNGMEVFEWDLTEKQAKFYYELLLKGAMQRNNKEDFITQDPVRLCSAAVSSFLLRFGGKLIPLHEHYTFPHGLAHELYTLNPDRIYYFETKQPVKIFAH